MIWKLITLLRRSPRHETNATGTNWNGAKTIKRRRLANWWQTRKFVVFFLGRSTERTWPPWLSAAPVLASGREGLGRGFTGRRRSGSFPRWWPAGAVVTCTASRAAPARRRWPARRGAARTWPDWGERSRSRRLAGSVGVRLSSGDGAATWINEKRRTSDSHGGSSPEKKKRG